MYNPIILTGGTGWVGKNFLHELQKRINYKEFNKKVFVFASKSGNLKSSAYPKKEAINIPVYPFSTLLKKFKNTPNIRIVHSAFLRKEKLDIIGFNNYVKANKYITKTIYDLLKSSKSSKILEISSGAAFRIENDKEKTLENDPYGFLKLEEENLLNSASNCLIMRIYGLTGQFMNSANIFAFGNFLLSALKNERINIKSRNNVIRSYGFASEIAFAGIEWLISNNIISKEITLSAATNTISLYELAQKITKIYNLPEINSQIDYSLPENKYTCELSSFRSFLSEMDVIPCDIENQIKITYNYLKNNCKE